MGERESIEMKAGYEEALSDVDRARGIFRKMTMDQLSENSGLEVFDDEEYPTSLALPLPESTAPSGQGLAQTIPPESIGKVGDFLTVRSDESHIGPFRWAVDFLVEDGSPIISSMGGQVIELKDDSDRWGDSSSYRNDMNFLTVHNDDGTFLQYCHLLANSANVKIGDQVESGQMLAQVGKSGWTDGDHLHIQMFKKDSSPDNPFGFKSLKINWDSENLTEAISQKP